MRQKINISNNLFKATFSLIRLTFILLFLIYSRQVKGHSCNAKFSPVNLGYCDIKYYEHNNTASTKYLWDYGNGATSRKKGLSHSLSPNLKSSKVCLMYHDTLSNFKDTFCQVVNGCSSSFWYRINKNSIELSANGKCRWDFGDGSTYTNDGRYFVHDYKKSGVYNLCLTITCITGDSSTTCIKIDNRCRAKFEYVADTSDKSKIIFTNLSTGNSGQKYGWFFGDHTGSDDTNPTHVYSKAAYYNIGLLINDDENNCHDSIGKTLIIGNPPCDTSFKFNFVRGFKSNKIFYLTNYNHPNLKFDFGDGTTSSENMAHHTYNSLGTFNFCMSYICHTKDTIKICKKVEIKCVAHFTKILDSTKKYKVILMNNSSPGTTNYGWDFGDGSTSNSQFPTHQYTRFGKFRVCLTATVNDCYTIFCDTVGMDSTGKLLKSGLWEIIVGGGPVETTKSLKSNFKIYPNPATNKILIELDNVGNTYNKLEILNNMGQVCMSQSLDIGSKTIELDIARLNNGLYLIKLINAHGYICSKMIKE